MKASISVSMYLFFRRTVYRTPFCRDVIVPNFSQVLVYIGGPPASCNRGSTFKRRSTPTVKSSSNKMVILQYSTVAIHNHKEKKRKKKDKSISVISTEIIRYCNAKDAEHNSYCSFSCTTVWGGTGTSWCLLGMWPRVVETTSCRGTCHLPIRAPSDITKCQLRRTSQFSTHLLLPNGGASGMWKAK